MIIRFILICILLMSPVMAAEPIKDLFVETTLDKNLEIPKPFILHLNDTLPVRTDLVIEYKKIPVYKDKLVETTLNGKVFEIPEPNLDYDYSDASSVIVKLHPKSKITTNGKLCNGDTVHFIVKEDVFFNGKLILQKDSEVSAIIENISPNDRYGVPANLVISRFSANGLDSKTLDGEFAKQGISKSIWVYPLCYFLMPFGGAGIPVTFIRGGNVKINPDDVVEIYYRPTRFRKSL